MSSQHIPVTGGCLCEAVRYRLDAPPVVGCLCHCTRCQSSYGGLLQVTVKFTNSAFQITKGKLKFYASSNFGKRGFCAKCGSPIVFQYEGNSSAWVLIGSLDHPEDWPLIKDASWGEAAHVYIDSKIPWYGSAMAWHSAVKFPQPLRRTLRRLSVAITAAALTTR